MARHSRGDQQRFFGYALIAGLLALLYYLLKNGSTFLHEGVSTSIITSAGTIVPDANGIPQFDTRIPATVPPGQGAAVAPIDANGVTNWNPSDPVAATCPMGYTKYHNVTDGTYQCVPNA